MSVLSESNVETGVFTDCMFRAGTIQRGHGAEFTVADTYSLQVGNMMQFEDSIVVGPVSQVSKISINGSSHSGGAVAYTTRLLNIGAGWGAVSGRMRDVTMRDRYAGIVNHAGATLQVYRVDDDAFTLLASAARAYASADRVQVRLSFDAGGAGGNQRVGVRDVTNNVTAGPIESTTYTTGLFGVETNAQWGWQFDYAYDNATPASSTYISPTLDAGSSIQWDVATWEESLGGGDATVDVDIRNAGNYGTWGITGLTTPTGSTFTATTGRYYNFRVNITGAAAITGLPQLAKGLDAGGGGVGNDTGGGAGFGRRRRKTRVIVLTQAQAKKLLA